MKNNKTLKQYLDASRCDAELASVVLGLATTCADLCGVVSRAGALGLSGNANSANVQGEQQKKLDVIANDLLLGFAEKCAPIAGVVSEELDDVYRLSRVQRGRYLLVIDPLDGSSNVEANISVGTIFSLLRYDGDDLQPRAEDFLQPGVQQVAAGYAIYGPSTLLTLTIGSGTHSFTFDWSANEYLLTQENLRVPERTHEFAINMSNQRFWETPVQRYVEECLAGVGGVRGSDFNMRWIASLVAESQRILARGGIFLYPRDNKEPRKAGRLRLLYEANPIAFLMEQAGASATTGGERILDLQPESLHQRVPLIFGSTAEVDRVVSYHRDPDEGAFQSPLFRNRNLYVQ